MRMSCCEASDGFIEKEKGTDTRLISLRRGSRTLDHGGGVIGLGNLGGGIYHGG